MVDVERLLNLGGDVDLDVNMQRQDTTNVRAMIDERLDRDSRGDPDWFDVLLGSEKFSLAETQLRDLKDEAEKRKIIVEGMRQCL